MIDNNNAAPSVWRRAWPIVGLAVAVLVNVLWACSVMSWSGCCRRALSDVARVQHLPPSWASVLQPQLGDVCCDLARLVAGQQLGGRPPGRVPPG